MMITERVTIQARQAFANKYLAEEPRATRNEERPLSFAVIPYVQSLSDIVQCSIAQTFQHLNGL